MPPSTWVVAAGAPRPPNSGAPYQNTVGVVASIAYKPKFKASPALHVAVSWPPSKLPKVKAYRSGQFAPDDVDSLDSLGSHEASTKVSKQPPNMLSPQSTSMRRSAKVKPTATSATAAATTAATGSSSGGTAVALNGSSPVPPRRGSSSMTHKGRPSPTTATPMASSANSMLGTVLVLGSSKSDPRQDPAGSAGAAGASMQLTDNSTTATAALAADAGTADAGTAAPKEVRPSVRQRDSRMSRDNAQSFKRPKGRPSLTSPSPSLAEAVPDGSVRVHFRFGVVEQKRGFGGVWPFGQSVVAVAHLVPRELQFEFLTGAWPKPPVEMHSPVVTEDDAEMKLKEVLASEEDIEHPSSEAHGGAMSSIISGSASSSIDDPRARDAVMTVLATPVRSRLRMPEGGDPNVAQIPVELAYRMQTPNRQLAISKAPSELPARPKLPGILGFRGLAQVLLDHGVRSADLYTATTKLELFAIAKVQGVDLSVDQRDSTTEPNPRHAPSEAGAPLRPSSVLPGASRAFQYNQGQSRALKSSELLPQRGQGTLQGASLPGASKIISSTELKREKRVARFRLHQQLAAHDVYLRQQAAVEAATVLQAMWRARLARRRVRQLRRARKAYLRSLQIQSALKLQASWRRRQKRKTEPSFADIVLMLKRARTRALVSSLINDLITESVLKVRRSQMMLRVEHMLGGADAQPARHAPRSSTPGAKMPSAFTAGAMPSQLVPSRREPHRTPPPLPKASVVRGRASDPGVSSVGTTWHRGTLAYITKGAEDAILPAKGTHAHDAPRFDSSPAPSQPQSPVPQKPAPPLPPPLLPLARVSLPLPAAEAPGAAPVGLGAVAPIHSKPSIRAAQGDSPSVVSTPLSAALSAASSAADGPAEHDQVRLGGDEKQRLRATASLWLDFLGAHPSIDSRLETGTPSWNDVVTWAMWLFSRRRPKLQGGAQGGAQGGTPPRIERTQQTSREIKDLEGELKLPRRRRRS